MAAPINVQDWYGDRHTCQIASGALVHERTVNYLSESECGLLNYAIANNLYYSSIGHSGFSYFFSENICKW